MSIHVYSWLILVICGVIFSSIAYKLVNKGVKHPIMQCFEFFMMIVKSD